MLIEVKEYRAAKGSDVAKLKLGTAHLVGKFTLTATNDTDAMQLAALAHAWIDCDNKALQKLRQESIEKFCKQRGMSLVPAKGESK